MGGIWPSILGANSFCPPLPFQHVLLSTDDYMVGSANLFSKLFLFASFNDHVTHHLFPTIDLSKQHMVRRAFLETCKECDIKYESHTFMELASGTRKVLQRREGDPCYTPAN